MPDFPKPPFPEQQQPVPGSSAAMDPKPDYGEKSYRGSGRLRDKKVLITGGNSGIGRAVALAFAREGADLLVSYLNEDEDARETKRLVEEAGRQCLLMPGDIADAGHCRKLVRKAADAFGRIDVLVNNAAHQMTFEAPEEISDEEWDRTFAVEYFRHVLSDQGCARAYEARRRDHQYSLDQRRQSEPAPAGLRDDQGRHSEFHRRAGADAGRAGNPGQRGGPGARMDAADPVDDAARQGGSFRRAGADEASGSTSELAPVYVLLASDEASYVSGTMVGVTGGKPILWEQGRHLRRRGQRRRDMATEIKDRSKQRGRQWWYKPYNWPAGGWGSARSLAKSLARERVLAERSADPDAAEQARRLCLRQLRLGQARRAASIRVLRERAKATNWEITTRRVEDGFFAEHTLRELEGWADHDLEELGRLTRPLRWDAQSDKYVPVEWAQLRSPAIGAELKQLDPKKVVLYSSGRASLEASYMYQLFARLYGTNNLPDSSNHVPREHLGRPAGEHRGPGRHRHP